MLVVIGPRLECSLRRGRFAPPCYSSSAADSGSISSPSPCRAWGKWSIGVAGARQCALRAYPRRRHVILQAACQRRNQSTLFLAPASAGVIRSLLCLAFHAIQVRAELVLHCIHLLVKSRIQCSTSRTKIGTTPARGSYRPSRRRRSKKI